MKKSAVVKISEADPVVFADPILSLEPLAKVSGQTYVVSLIAVIVPFAGFVLAIAFLWGHGFGWLHGSLLLSMYIVSATGVTVGYHRYFCHRAFQTPKVIQCLLAVSGAMAVQGPILKWVAMHRCHHHHSDRDGDPHSPHDHDEEGVLGVLRGMWHAHVGWIFRGDPQNLTRYIPDLAQDRLLRVMSGLWLLWAFLGILIPAAIGGLLSHSWMGALLGGLWGGLARIFLMHHITWSINSVCHLWGTRPFASHDHSRNNFVFGVLALGEGWHNNHHAFPTSARHGLRWWEIDIGYVVIRSLSLVGLAWDVKVPSIQRRTNKLATS